MAVEYGEHVLAAKFQMSANHCMHDGLVCFEDVSSRDIYTNAKSWPAIRSKQRPDGRRIFCVHAVSTNQYTLDITFGVSMTTLRCLNKIISLTETKDTASPEVQWLAQNRTDIEALEAELFGLFEHSDAFNTLDDPSASSSSTADYVNEEIKQNHMWAFHYSAAIFFRRALYNGQKAIDPNPKTQQRYTTRAASQLSGQALVAKALEHLENIDAISSETKVANTLWVAFIAAVEAVNERLRRRALSWFGRARRHRIGNIAKAKVLVMEVWRKLDLCDWQSPACRDLNSELGSVDWRDVMRERGTYIMLT